MRFSVVVPVYNIQPYITQCVDSILNQRFSDFEVILVDDGSTDRCPIICDQYAKSDDRVRVIHKSNGGLVSARQAGCKEADGEYVLCVDGDDWVSENYLQTLEEIIELHHPDIVCFGYFIVRDSKRISANPPVSEGLYDKDRIKKDIYPSLICTSAGTSFPTSIWSKAIIRNIYVDEQLSLSPKIKIGEDSACVIPCIWKADSVFVTKNCLYYYRHNETSMTKEKKRFDSFGPELVGEHLNNRVDTKQGDFEQQINRRTVRALLNVIKSLFYDLDYKTAKLEALKLLDYPYYKKAVENANFSCSLIALFIKCSIISKNIFPIYLLSKFK